MGRSRFDRRRSCRNGSRSSDGISDSAIGRSFSVEVNYIHIIFGNSFSAFVRRFLALLWRRRLGTFIFRATGGAKSLFFRLSSSGNRTRRWPAGARASRSRSFRHSVKELSANIIVLLDELNFYFFIF